MGSFSSIQLLVRDAARATDAEKSKSRERAKEDKTKTSQLQLHSEINLI